MIIPSGMSQHDVLAAIEAVICRIPKSAGFGHYGRDDIQQEARVYALEALQSGKYDTSRPLVNYLYSHVRNRLFNLKRDKLMRNDPPCSTCHAGRPCGEGNQECADYRAWQKRNMSKANLMRPIGLEHVADEKERRMHQDAVAEKEAETIEILEIIDAELPVELRADYLRMRAGVTIICEKRNHIENVVLGILRNHGISVGELGL